MPAVEIVTVGTELLLGTTLDTNSAHVARVLAENGIDVFAKHSVGDNIARLATLLEEILERADGAITTGGLGPTVDDLTKDAIAKALEVPLELHQPSLDAIEARFVRLGRTMSPNNRNQAYLPRGAYALANPHGTAPGFVAQRGDGKFIAAMPGVPREMRPMLEEQLLPWFAQRYGTHQGIFTRTLHTCGMSESELDTRIEDLFRSGENPKIAVLAHEWRVDVKIMAKAADERAAETLIAPVEHEIRARLGEAIFGSDAQTLEGTIVAALAQAQLTLATAESITGGAIADAIVRVPGASVPFRGAVVAYANDVKTNLLGVDPELLQRAGAVSEEVAAAMASGARKTLGADYALASTGIAGPTGATASKPLGLVWFAIAGPGGVVTQRTVIPGDRDDIRRRAVVVALNFLRRSIPAKNGSLGVKAG